MFIVDIFLWISIIILVLMIARTVLHRVYLKDVPEFEDPFINYATIMINLIFIVGLIATKTLFE